jgi:hypothetical protein
MKHSIKLTFLALAVASLSACMPNYSNGSRAGVVNKLSEKGLVFKSYEGEMMLGGIRTTENGTAANLFAFNVDPSQVAAVTAAMKSGKRVELVYRQWAVSPLTINSDYVIVDVKPAE